MTCQYDIRIACPDRPGIIAALTGFLFDGIGGNVLELNHHTETGDNRFFLICRFEVSDDRTEQVERLDTLPAFAALRDRYGWDFSLHNPGHRPRLGVLVTQTDHCLYELILKCRSGYLHADLCCVISNREALRGVAEQFDLPFYHHPMDGGRERQEERVMETLAAHGAEAVALARYMQILTPAFLEAWESRIVNVHHGFLPAFKGAKPYHQAWQKGVKIIGATAHYATVDLDEGPILFQDVASVGHNRSVAEFIERGQDVERRVLVEGLKLHLERRVFVVQGRTIVL